MTKEQARWRPSRDDRTLIEYGTIEKYEKEMAIGDACDLLTALEASRAQLLATLKEGLEMLTDADVDGSTEERAVDLAIEYADLWGWADRARQAIEAAGG